MNCYNPFYNSSVAKDHCKEIDFDKFPLQKSNKEFLFIGYGFFNKTCPSDRYFHF